jgi:transcriptional regulator with XRE-family HTH domain
MSRTIPVGRRIAALREQLGWSQPELAAKVGVARNTITRVERALADPSVDLLRRLAEVFGVPLTMTITPTPRRRNRR